MIITKTRAPTGRREKQAEKSCREQHAVRLIARKILGGGDKGKIRDKANGRHAARPDIEHQKYGRGQTGPAQKHERGRSTDQPEERGRIPEGVRAEVARHGLKVGAGRKNSVGPDKPADLKKQGVKSGEENK